MHCPDAAEFASYMMGMLSDEARERIDRHLARCERCREHIAAVVRLRSDPAVVQPDAAFPRAWARVEEQLASWTAARSEQHERSGNIITLLPRPRRTPSASVDRLAATTVTQTDTEPVSFFSADGTLAAKVTRADRELEIYLVSDDPARTRGVLTRVVSPTGELIAEGVSDEFGVLTVPGTIVLDPSTARVELILPHATIALEPSVWRDRLIATGSTELRSLEGHILHLEVIERGARREYRIDLSAFQREQPALTLRVYATREGRSTELPVGPEGAALFQEPDATLTTLRAYVVSP